MTCPIVSGHCSIILAVAPLFGIVSFNFLELSYCCQQSTFITLLLCWHHAFIFIHFVSALLPCNAILQQSANGHSSCCACHPLSIDFTLSLYAMHLSKIWHPLFLTSAWHGHCQVIFNAFFLATLSHCCLWQCCYILLRPSSFWIFVFPCTILHIFFLYLSQCIDR